MLAHCRVAVSRYPGIKLVWFVAMLGLVIVSMPRWEVHQHADIEAHHAFEPSSHDHLSGSLDTDASPDVGEAVFSHCHAVPSIAVAIFPSNLPSLEPVLLTSVISPEPETAFATNAGPPPQRPPIV